MAHEAIVTNQPGDSVSIIDLDTMKSVAVIQIGGKPAGVAVFSAKDVEKAYITSPDSKELVEVDIVTKSVTRRIKIGDGPLGVAANPPKWEVYVADWYAHKISVISAFPFAFVTDPQPQHKIVADDVPMTGELHLTRELQPIAEIPVGQSPSGLAVTPDGKLLLSADRDSNQVSVIDIDSRKVIATVKTGERPFGVTIDAEGRRAYTANVASDDVTVIDIASRAAVGTVKVGHRPYAVALAKGRGFVTDQYSGTVTVFDLATLAPIKAIVACDHPEGIEATGSEDAVYAACWGDNLLLRIDPTTLTVTAKAATGDGPRAFGKFLR